MRTIRRPIYAVIIAAALISAFLFLKQTRENRLLNQIILRLKADSRIAEVLVTKTARDADGREATTIKFLEYDVDGNPLKPKYFTFYGNTIQFQSLVIRFDDFYVERAHPLRGRSAYLFMKAFVLAGKDTQEFPITEINSIPGGYKVGGAKNKFEAKLWEKFWRYALDPEQAKRLGVKNAQIEAPGTRFFPGSIYTIKIEHDGGMRIDAHPIAPILRGEKIG